MTVVEVRTRAGATLHTGREDGPFADGPVLFIWQDRRTASSAEVFTAALTGNGRARSIGETTYGKGVTQRASELVNGAALLLTDGRLLPPGGLDYDGKGLPPGIAVEAPGDAACRAATPRPAAEPPVPRPAAPKPAPSSPAPPEPRTSSGRPGAPGTPSRGAIRLTEGRRHCSSLPPHVEQKAGFTNGFRLMMVAPHALQNRIARG
ncbi:MAG: S41 family peptidase [Kiritimatiellia bacterium]